MSMKVLGGAFTKTILMAHLVLHYTLIMDTKALQTDLQAYTGGT